MNPTADKAMISDYRRVENAIRYLEAHFQQQPGLDELAAEVGLSPYHFQRLFQRWAGISPKRFLQYLTLEYCKQRLDANDSVLDAAYTAGLSGASRLYDHFVSLEAITPGEYKLRGRDLCIRYGRHASPFGEVFIATTQRGICSLVFIENEQEAEQALHALHTQWSLAETIEDAQPGAQLLPQLFASSAQTKAPVAVLVKGSNFQVQVWKALLSIEPGAVSTYGQLATAIGKPQAARAVGSAVGANPVAYLIPCHRVIRAGGNSGEYRWGPLRKKALLAWEAARCETHA